MTPRLGIYAATLAAMAQVALASPAAAPEAPRPSRPSWAGTFRDSWARPPLQELAEARRHEELVDEVVRRLRRGDRVVSTWTEFQRLLPAIEPEAVAKTLASLRVEFGRDPAVALVTARVMAHPPWPSLHDAAAARRALEYLAEEEDRVGPLARFELARLDLREDPGRAAKNLRALVESKQAPLELSGLAALALGACYQRTGRAGDARNLYLQGLRRFGRIHHGEGGTLAPWFRHGLAESLIALEAHRAARTELMALLETYPEYPGQQAARSLLTTLAKGR